MDRYACIELKGLKLDCAFSVVENFRQNTEEVQWVSHVYLNGVDIAHVITEEFEEELIEEYYNQL